MTGERHLGQRREHAAIGAIVIGEHQVLRAQLGDARRRTAPAARGSSQIGRVAPSSPIHLRQPRAAEPVAPGAEIDQQQRRRAEIGAQLRRPGRRTSRTGANAETISDTGATMRLARRRPRSSASSSTANPCRPEWRCRAPDRAPRRRRAPWRTAPRLRPARRRPPSSWPTASRLDSAPMSAARMLVSASATARRPDAGASSTATGVRSPIAMASPRGRSSRRA